MNAALRSAGFSPLQRQVRKRDVGLFPRNYNRPVSRWGHAFPLQHSVRDFLLHLGALLLFENVAARQLAARFSPAVRPLRRPAQAAVARREGLLSHRLQEVRLPRVEHDSSRSRGARGSRNLAELHLAAARQEYSAVSRQRSFVQSLLSRLPTVWFSVS